MTFTSLAATSSSLAVTSSFALSLPKERAQMRIKGLHAKAEAVHAAGNAGSELIRR